MLSGLKNGFHTGLKHLPTENLVCRNLLSVKSQSHITNELIQREVEKQFAIGPSTEIPFLTYRINPIGVAEGKLLKEKTFNH